MTRSLQALSFATLVILGSPIGVMAQVVPRLCDTQFEDCRAPLIQLIRNEKALASTSPPDSIGIDVAFWFMEDARYVPELVAARNAGVPVRVLIDQNANNSHPYNATILDLLRNGGIPMRDKAVGPILHFKMMLFHGQNVLQFSKANYTDFAFKPQEPNVNYADEAIFFTNDSNLTNSFRKRFDDLWVSPEFKNFSNFTDPPVAPRYPTATIHPSMNFPPLQDFVSRMVKRFDAEPQRIDAIAFRVTDDRTSDAVLRALGRGIPVRLLTEPDEYRDPDRLWHSKHVDRMWYAGAQIKQRQHQGNLHQASVVLQGLGEVIFGTSNWTKASANSQDEHNYFYNPTLGKPEFFQWFADQFENKWNDSANYVQFQPQPPGKPSYVSPLNLASGLSSSVTLTWDGGTWAHLYDIYFGTTPNPPLLPNATNLKLGSPVAGQRETFTVGNLVPGTTYYWRIVGKTWAYLENSGPTWSFTTAGSPPPGGGGSSAYGGTPAAIPGTFQAEHFDEGGQSVAYYDTTAGNAGGVFRSTDVDLESTGDTGGGYNVARTRVGEWLKYSVNVAASGTYRLETRVANVGTGARFQVEVDGVDRTGPIAVPDTGGWQAWQTVTTAGIPLTAGARVIRVVFVGGTSTGGVGNYNWFRLVESSSSSSTTPYGGTPVSLPGTVQAENFDIGAQNVAYYDTSSGNSGSVYRSTDVDVGPTGDPSSGGYYVGWTRAGEWLKYTVNVTQSRTYTLNVRVANAGSGARFRVEADGTDLTGPISVPNTGAWDAWQTVSVNVNLSQGQRVIRLFMVSSNSQNAGIGNFGYLSFQ